MHREGEQRRGGERATARSLLAVASALSLQGCAWVGLTWGALHYPTTQAGAAANVVVRSEHAYVTRGNAGIEIIALGPDPRSMRMPLPAGIDSADDVAVADGLLFVLDARAPGHLAVFSLADPAQPRLAGPPVDVDVGPFSGVSAAAGRVIVSGGTSRLSLRRYDTQGRLGTDIATADFGRGQPDVLLSVDGLLAVISTHDWGPYFRLTLARLSGDALAIAEAGSLPLDTYGFTPGGAKPANFPLESALDGSLLYAASADGLAVIDVRDPSAPRPLALLDPGVRPVNVDVHDGIAAMVGSVPKPLLVLADVSAPAHPRILQSFPLPDGSLATAVALTPSQVVIAAGGRGSLLFDRSRSAWEQIRQ